MSEIKLFCLPYAGGSTVIYNKWKSFLNSRIELIPIELAARGKRFGDVQYADFSAAVDDAFNLITEKLDGSSYMIFGHSMGAAIAHGVWQKILSNNMQQPVHIFFSGCRAPHLEDKRKKYHLMGEDEFKNAILDLGGTPPELFAHPELLDVFLPLLRNDFKIVETRSIHKNITCMPFPISILFGKQDDFSAVQCDSWKKHTSALCSMYHFEGDHFFLHQHTEQLVKLINSTAAEIY